MDISPTTVRIIARRNNDRGDLFARLLEGYFFSLGYSNCRFSIHKTGREIDVEASHRTETRRAVAECKAKATKTGGGDINKFVGVLDVERRRAASLPVVGYFVSLSGFSESAVEQESDAGGDRVILVTGAMVADALVTANLIMSPVHAAERAAVLISARSKLRRYGPPELLAHATGWLWAIYYGSGRDRTHYALVHASGEPLAAAVAARVVADAPPADILRKLDYLQPVVGGSTSREGARARAQEAYSEYLAREFGWVTFEGLPADQAIGSKKLALDRIFVPLHFERSNVGDLEPTNSDPTAGDSSQEERQRLSLRSVLRRSRAIAVLAPPGGGKSTLIKHLAVAYTNNDQEKTADKLPSADLLPLVVRCRQLGEQVDRPILEILDGIPARAELPHIQAPFTEVAREALISGKALVLVDGLDEISDSGARLRFAQQVRTFIATYPATTVIITSRIAGFRVVAPALAGACDEYRLSNLSDGDIEALVAAWHREVVDDSDSAREVAAKLANQIVQNARLRNLGQNPLLLTTLLLVNRWVGELPRRRTALYSKAIEVLLMTWNVEGHAPLDPEEAVPQLAFVAFAMLVAGEKVISVRRLQTLLSAARTELPEMLAYTKLTVSEFVQRVEDRSSVLSLSGHGLENGDIVELYEFKHLTFQEYLAAVALVNGYYQSDMFSSDLADLLQPYFYDPDWKEVIPLLAVLLGRDARELIEALLDRTKRTKPSELAGSSLALPHAALTQCLADEAQMSPQLALKACDWTARRMQYELRDEAEQILTGRYGSIFADNTKKRFITSKRPDVYSAAFETVVEQSLELNWASPRSKDLSRVERSLTSPDVLEIATGCVALMDIAFRQHEARGGRLRRRLVKLGDISVQALWSDEIAVQFASAWALAWLAACGWSPARRPAVILRLLEIWREDQPGTRTWAAWALSRLPLLPRDSSPIKGLEASESEFIRTEFAAEKWEAVRRVDIGPAALVVGYYARSPWEDDELVELITTTPRSFDRQSDLLANLGSQGRKQLQELAAYRD